MAQNAPGRHYRKGLSLRDLTRLFPDDATAEQWFRDQRWPDGVHCPYCGSDKVQTGAKHKSMPFRCRAKECTKRFSVKTGTIMQSSKVGYQTWVFAMYLLTTNLKGISSMKLHRELGITQKSAWHLAHRLRDALASGGERMAGPVEADETYMGGKNANKHSHKKIKNAHGTMGKTAVVGVKDRETNTVQAAVIGNTARPTLSGFVAIHAAPGAKARASLFVPFSGAGVKDQAEKSRTGHRSRTNQGSVLHPLRLLDLPLLHFPVHHFHLQQPKLRHIH